MAVSGTLWCRDIRTVTVPRGEPKPVTLVVPYYENPEFLAYQLSIWTGYPADLARFLSIIVVDDGSPDAPAAAVLERSSVPARFRLFRIEVDVRWNWLAARNIGAHHAGGGWILLTDMDHVVPTATLEAVILGAHDPATVYAFARRDHTGAIAAPHSASFLLTRALFWRVGGYDEALSGYYGTDGEYRRRLAEVARLALLSDVLVRWERQGDSSTRRYLRKQPQDARVRALVAARPASWRPKVLSFPYHEVALCRA